MTAYRKDPKLEKSAEVDHGRQNSVLARDVRKTVQFKMRFLGRKSRNGSTEARVGPL